MKDWYRRQERRLRGTVAGRVLWRRLPIGIFVVALLGVASDFLSVTRTFWTSHALFTELLVTALALAFAGAVLDSWNKETDALRYRRLRNIGYKALIDWIISARDALVMLVAGDYPYQAREPLPCVPPELIADADNRGLERRGERLDLLLQQAEFANHAYDSVCTLTKHARERVGLWAPPLATSRGLRGGFARVALLVDGLEDLERPLNTTHRCNGKRGIVDDDRRRSTCELWEELITSSIVFEESLKRELGERWRGWPSAARELLSAEGHDRVDLPVGEATKRLRAIRGQVRKQYPPSFEAKGHQLDGKTQRPA
jgi:hypothetical protein